MKALIPAAGLGTRYLPLSKAVPKELIPVGKFPVLHHVVAEAKAAGCTRIGILLSEGKEAIRQYFRWDAPLMEWLDRTGKRAAMAEWEALMEGLEFTWLNQPEQRGLGDAILCGESFAAGEAVCVLLGDTIMEGGSPLPAMVRRHRATGRSQVAVELVPAERATKYGVCWGTPSPDGALDLHAMIEKPSFHEMNFMESKDEGQKSKDQISKQDSRQPAANDLRPAANDLRPMNAFAARYVLTPAIYGFLRTLPPGRNGEIQLTDAMAAVMEKEGFGAVPIPGKRRDIGSPEVA
ncbi:MAG: sugar phosphate nucleotidyltransferase [Oceanipulchritudo sp.]|jgi:UTP--glucose-1-phosphate uridylyltransferase